jgi:peptidoglycan/xylan/chitin deacetylase (PgdA/CDA1 family)
MSLSSDKLPILTFHALEENPAVASFPPDLFASALAQWKASGWDTIPLEAAARLAREGASFPPRRFVLTFDDGYASFYRIAFPLLQEYGMTATIFVAPGVGAPPGPALPRLFDREMLRWSEIRELHAHGVTIGAHTLTHPDLTRLAPAEAALEISESREVLVQALGAPVTLFAYPYGRLNGRVRALAAEHFEAACSDQLGYVRVASDLLALERVDAYYLRSHWAVAGFVRPWFPGYLNARSWPRRLRRNWKD